MPIDTTKLVLNFNSKDSLFKNINNILLISKGKHQASLLGISQESWSNIVIPIIIPIFAFALAFLFTSINNKIRLLNELRRKQEFLFVWIDLIESRITKQCEAFREYSKCLKNLEINKEGINHSTFILINYSLLTLSIWFKFSQLIKSEILL